jgi:protein-S-isoprenylcysteine O-methyltransferase Ste14
MLRSSFTLAVQLLPAILLVMLGWGFDNLSAFFLNPARAGLAALAFASAAIAVILRLDFDPLRKGSNPQGHQGFQLGVLLFLSLVLLWFLPFADSRQILTLQYSYWRYLGLALLCVGAGVRLFALRALGKHFSAYITLQPDHRLVRDGIYAHIRHPLYLSLLLLPTGIAFVFNSALAAPILLLAAAFVMDRIRKEDRILARHFGEEFEEYRRHTRALLPA